jgi:hypothetical protein
MKLYVCWGTFEVPFHDHPCREALLALEKAGFEPEVVKAHGLGPLPMALQGPTRKMIKDQTGSAWVPALETGDGEWISGSQQIIDWAAQHATEATPA